MYRQDKQIERVRKGTGKMRFYINEQDSRFTVPESVHYLREVAKIVNENSIADPNSFEHETLRTIIADHVARLDELAISHREAILAAQKPYQALAISPLDLVYLFRDRTLNNERNALLLFWLFRSLGGKKLISLTKSSRGLDTWTNTLWERNKHVGLAYELLSKNPMFSSLNESGTPRAVYRSFFKNWSEVPMGRELSYRRAAEVAKMHLIALTSVADSLTLSGKINDQLAKPILRMFLAGSDESVWIKRAEAVVESLSEENISMDSLVPTHFIKWFYNEYAIPEETPMEWVREIISFDFN